MKAGADEKPIIEETMDILNMSAILNKIDPKTMRTMKRLWLQLIDLKNYDIPRTFEDYKAMKDLFSKPKLVINQQELFLKDSKIKLLRDFTQKLYDMQELKAIVSYNCIYHNILKGMQNEFVKELDEIETSFDENLQLIINGVLSEVGSYEFYWVLGGIELKGINSINFGNVEIFNFTQEMSEQFNLNESTSAVKFYEEGLQPHIQKNFINQVCAKCKIVGEKRQAEDFARQQIQVAINFFRFMICFEYWEYIYQNVLKVNFQEYMPGQRGAGIHFDLNKKDFAIAYSSNRSIHEKYSITDEKLKLYNDQFLYQDMKEIFFKKGKTEWESSILTAMYWCGEAQEEWVAEFAYLKFWTAIETLFAPSTNKVTKEVLSGSTVLLTYGLYNFSAEKEFWTLHSELNRLYDKRSRIVHSGLSGAITPDELGKICKYTSWLILNSVFLRDKGYSKIKQVKEWVSWLYKRQDENKKLES